MLNLALGEHYEQFVQRQLEAGRYGSASEVVHAALAMMEESELAHEKWLGEEIPARYEEFLKAPSQAVSAEMVRGRFEIKHRARLADAE